MKKSWNGVAFKNHLWKCATSTTVPEFKAAMLELKEFNGDCYTWLSKIPAHHWSRSHFSGRAGSDMLLNNMCEIFNRWLVDARDKPIITALEYIREYLMKRIVNVNKMISKCEGPLSPYGTKMFDKIKHEASKYTVLWNGAHQYQVSGPHQDQCVVDMELKVCACRRWEITGMPCKHAVAAINIMGINDEKVRDPERWVSEVYSVDN
ncbi:uncharacterized protein [Rutidosis leptorrhynchoides]|uniref:uncharacterized protein n=1 Tax=Rutidosis leptorrhynchoides TaxID=125765 RepID=UPI003A991673